MKDARMKEHSYHQRWGVEAKRTIQRELVKILLSSVSLPTYFSHFSTITSLLNLVYKHLGFTISFGLHFSMRAPMDV